jgi:hypothetical protein
LYKAGANPATVRIENTTVAHSSNCPTIYTEIYNGTGGVVDPFAVQGDNSAATYTFSTEGEYYIEVNLNTCQPGASGPAVFSIEPDPRAGWTTAP